MPGQLFQTFTALLKAVLKSPEGLNMPGGVSSLQSYVCAIHAPQPGGSSGSPTT